MGPINIINRGSIVFIKMQRFYYFLFLIAYLRENIQIC
jgi:hypothetical protein